MNDMDHVDPLGEDTLRRALRLEADERPLRLDARALVAAATHRTGRDRALRTVRGMALLGAAASVEVLVAVGAFSVLTDVDTALAMGALLTMTASVAERVVALGSLAASPAIGLATLATILFASIYERTGREPNHVRAS